MEKTKYKHIIAALSRIDNIKIYLLTSCAVRSIRKLSVAIIFLLSAWATQQLITSSYNIVHYYIVAMIPTITVISFIDTYISSHISNNILNNLRETIYNKLYDIAPIKHKFTPVLGGDLETFERFYSTILVEYLSTIITVITLLGLLLFQSTSVFLITFITAIFLIVIPQLIVSCSEAKDFNLKQLYNQLHSVISDGVLGLNSQLERTYLAKVHAASSEYDYYNGQFKFTIEKNILYTIGSISFIISLAFLFLTREPNSIYIFSIVFIIISEILKLSSDYSPIFAVAKKLMNIFNLKPAVIDTGSVRSSSDAFKTLPLCVSFNNVTFESNFDSLALDDVSFTTNNITAIISDSHCAIVQLLQRFYDVDKGQICINAINIKYIVLSDLRKLIFCVSIDNHLFNTSIEDNLRLANPTISFKEIETAAVLTNADFFIKQLPKGYQSTIDLISLSTEQKLLILLTQALLLNTPILILVDFPETLLNDNLLLLFRSSKTVITFSKEFSSTSSYADKVIFVKNGMVQQVI
ncbi:MAG: hypothetical protein BEN18_09145 [Epulopiscium sp. Nuni2H_MBin001]|nr:MAG: hypothetical protein BEN18_09145 [Epulopiscium sp. Nuni2H_MBin001]